MRRRRLQLAVVVGVLGLMGVVAAAVAGDGNRNVREHLTGYEEVAAAPNSRPSRRAGPATSGPRCADDRIEYKLTYGGLEGDVLQAHIHLGARAIAGGISVFLCRRPGNGAGGHAGLPRPARRHRLAAPSSRPT